MSLQWLGRRFRQNGSNRAVKVSEGIVSYKASWIAKIKNKKKKSNMKKKNKKQKHKATYLNCEGSFAYTAITENNELVEGSRVSSCHGAKRKGERKGGKWIIFLGSVMGVGGEGLLVKRRERERRREMGGRRRSVLAKRWLCRKAVRLVGDTRETAVW